MKIKLGDLGVLDAPNRLLSKLAIALGDASEGEAFKGNVCLSKDYKEMSDDIFKALDEIGYYDNPD